MVRPENKPVSWLQQFETDSDNWATSTGFPRQLLRHLIFAHDLGIGSRVLDAGCGRGELVRFFNHLGIDAAGLDESAEMIVAARRTAPRGEFHCGTADSTVPFDTGDAGDTGRFDLVVARPLTVYDNDLFSSRAFQATANLLASLRPGGSLVFLTRHESAGDDPLTGHSQACYRQHLEDFPGTCSLREFPDGWTHSATWKRILARQPRGGFLTVTIQIPQQRLARADWIRVAHEASHLRSESCCPWSRTAGLQAINWRKAA